MNYFNYSLWQVRLMKITSSYVKRNLSFAPNTHVTKISIYELCIIYMEEHRWIMPM